MNVLMLRIGLNIQRVMLFALIFGISCAGLSKQINSAINNINSQDNLYLPTPMKIVWRFDAPDYVELSPASSNELVFIPLAGGKLIAVQLADGRLVWRAEIGGELSASPIANADYVIVSSAQENNLSEGAGVPPHGTLRALGVKSGVTIWSLTLESPVVGNLAVSKDTIFATTKVGEVFALKKESGQMLWRRGGDIRFTDVYTMSGGFIYIAERNGTVYALDQNTGQTKWVYPNKSSVKAISSHQGQLFIGTVNKRITSLSEVDGSYLWQSKLKGNITSISPTPEGILASSLDNFVYLFNMKSGKTVWKRNLSGRVIARPLIIDDYALFAPLSGDECVVLSLKTGKKVNALFVGRDNTAAASPVHSNGILLLPTRNALLAWSNGKD